MITAGRVLVVLGMVAALFAGTASSASAWTLSVDKNAPGYVSGTGIDCGSDCSQTYSNNCAYDPQVGGVVCDPVPATVTASSANGFAFSSWNGCDTVNGANCTVDGGIDTTVTANFNDVQAPTATLTAPSGGVRGGTITISGTATDNSGQVASMRFFVRGTQIATDSTAPYSASFDSTTIADGSAQIAVEAVDPSGNISSASGVTVTIDNTVPSLSAISGPGAGPFGPNTTQSFSWTASDSGSGIKSVQCKRDANAYGACTTSGTMSYSNLGDGSHTLTVLVTDNADHTTSKTYTWSIDAVAPTAQITGGPADGSSSSDNSATFSFTADEQSTFQCRVYQAALTAPAFEACNGTGSHTVSGLAPGTYAFEVKALDTVGNASAPVKRTFTVTTPPPTTTGSGTDTTAGGVGAPAGGGSGTSSSGSDGSGTGTGPTALPAIAGSVSAKWSVKAGKSRATLLKLAKLPAAAAIKVTCKGKGCPFKSKAFKPKAGAVDLTKVFKKKTLAAGSKITITITSPGMTGRQIVFTTQKKKQPKKSVTPV